MFCNKCGAQLNDNAKFCYNCGAAVIVEPVVQVRVCNACGVQLDDNVKFCYNCGAKVMAESVPQVRMCNICGAQLDENAKFCYQCGARVNEENVPQMGEIVSQIEENTSQIEEGIPQIEESVSQVSQMEETVPQIVENIPRIEGNVPQVKICRSCGAQLDADAVFCDNCGAKVNEETVPQIKGNVPQVKICRSCGAQLDADAVFCNNCGAKVKAETVSQIEGNAPQVKICRSCGAQLDADAVFCDNCGARADVEYTPSPQAEVKQVHADAKNREKRNWKELLTRENFEKYAPMTTFIPLVWLFSILAFGVLNYVIGFLENVFWRIDLLCIIFSFVGSVLYVAQVGLYWVLTGVAIVAAIGFLYLAVRFKDVSRISTWIAPFAGLCTAFCCLGALIGGIVFIVIAEITGIIAVCFGIVLCSQQPLDEPLDLKSVLEDYKRYYGDHKERAQFAKDQRKSEAFEGSQPNKERVQSTKNQRKSEVFEGAQSKFDGTAMEAFGMLLLLILLGAPCFILLPWILCIFEKWKRSHTVIDGKRLTFIGKGVNLFLYRILWDILTVITCGIFGLFREVVEIKWMTKHTFIEGEVRDVNEQVSYFDGGALEYFTYTLAGSLLCLLTLGLALPLMYAFLTEWQISHTVINGRRLAFCGKYKSIFVEAMIYFALILFTCGLAAPWAMKRWYSFLVRNTSFAEK